MEQLWSRAVAAQLSPSQSLTTRSRRKQAETVALGFAPPHEHLDGKEEVDARLAIEAAAGQVVVLLGTTSTTRLPQTFCCPARRTERHLGRQTDGTLV
jgi:hypothetical protein